MSENDMVADKFSIVEYFGEAEAHRCGYCKTDDSNLTHGMWAHSMTVQDYQNLIDRGWRRSGSYCYKPIMNRICCPMYTTRCEALKFKLSKSQKKVLKKMIKFLKGDLKTSEMDVDKDEKDNGDINTLDNPNYKKYMKKVEKSNIKFESLSKESVDSSTLLLKANNDADGYNLTTGTSSESVTVVDNQKVQIGNNKDYTKNNSNNSNSLSNLNTSQESSEILDRGPCRKAKLIRIERKQKKLLSQGKTQEEIDIMFEERKKQNQEKTLEDFFDEINNCKKKLELRMIESSLSNSEFREKSKNALKLYQKYEAAIHCTPEDRTTQNKFERFLVKSPLQIKLVKAKTEEFFNTLEANCKLYKKYQTIIHREQPEECDKDMLINFLVKGPLQYWKPDNGPSHGYGSFHEQYWLDGELIAVAVIDILPLCISSVYFYYDPAYAFLSLGTFSSLREVYLVRQLNKLTLNLKYYYMGYYIHSCPKMRYKARIKPSKLLCPETYVWCDLQLSLAKLEKQKYSRLNDDRNAIDENGSVNIKQVLILYKHRAMPYTIFRNHKYLHSTDPEENDMKEFAQLVGAKCVQSLLVYRG